MFGKFSFFPEQASEHARNVDLLYYALIGMSVFFTVLICTLVVIFAIRYRKKPGNELAQPLHEHFALEVAWSVIPFVIALGLFWWGVKLFIPIYSEAPENSLEIFGVGKQWMWKFQHPEGRREINDLHVPVGKPVKVTLISQDVIHSFYIPALRIKRDVLPVTYSTIWFVADRPGTYHLFCAEYCGLEHSKMVGKVIAMEQTDYQAWLASPVIEGDKPRDGSVGNVASIDSKDPIARGKAVFESQGCVACHRPDNAAIAPILEGLWGHKQELEGGKSVIVDAAYIRESILVPAAKVAKGFMPVMASYQGRISEEEIQAVIDYIKATSGGKR